ncbi:amidohydrolase [Novosphingobium sp. PC22D]|uniref:amidohydrolase family protein n=1 Tax=Novosphingobium sp. PC22D TaxID=1962403 RepID=UPI000BF10CC3|nr:amidohydrolase family protein [Novosphingobium sp. PC22D]PEQ11306.1 amidohydrolase [Novosphingobium sp. PC22D]
MSASDASVIDIHAHAVLPQTFEQAGRFGPWLFEEEDGTPVFRIGEYRLRNVRYRGSAFMEPEVRLVAMDRSGIAFQLLSPNPLTYFHYIPAEEATRFCRRHNDAMADLVAAYPDRLAGSACLPMQDIPAAIEELDRAVRDLGLRAAYIGTDLPLGLDDPAMDPFYARVVELDVPLFLHPAPAGIDGPAGSPALKKYELDILAGFTMQETIAVATLIFGGVLHRHPGIDICISHGGGALALVWGRLRHAAHKRPWVADYLRADGAFEEEARKLWFDIHMHDDEALALLARRVGTSRLVYGTNFAGWDAPERFTLPVIDAPLADNARRLLRL